MSATFTFGSLGDIITISQLVYQLARALDDSRGSSKSYQELRKDLDVFGQILVQLIAAFEMFDSSAWLSNIDTITRSVVADCAGMIKDALDHLAKYDSSLRPGGSGNRVKDTFNKVKWLGEKQNIEELREKLRTGSERITMLLNIASKVSARLDCRTMLSRIDDMDQILKDQQKCYEATANHLEAQLEKSHRKIYYRLDSIQAAVDNEQGGIQMLLLFTKSSLCAVKGVQQMLGQVFQAVLSLHDLVSRTVYFRSLDPTKGLPIILEDALGNVREVPLNWLHSWEGLHDIILHSFENQKGYRLVQRKQYALEDGTTSQELDLRRPFSLRRGMKINMSMIFPGTGSPVCPRCRRGETAGNAREGQYSQCATQGCGFLFMRFELLQQATSQAAMAAGTGSSKQRIELLDEEPSDFCRVRLFLRRQKQRSYMDERDLDRIIACRGTHDHVFIKRAEAEVRRTMRIEAIRREEEERRTASSLQEAPVSQSD
ncbi:hypothetical protein CONLIGDRAFT_328831 [Coniochaeta ligniaria NRRL 30616]|uniref:Ubiquitin-like domain-containing protein n=1 Tax=Coniochaeta ligniaria NRRL 30616 TaxID=1408157 RepID=A0A1J7IPC6_9PEZI|nr:hypothetical protein CONLIGDRAFT_328831 [Coniochaeta ligniaria NRRL 30616]